MKAREAFASSNPNETTAFYDALIRRGKLGQVAFGLFRAQKRNTRAKMYGKRKFRGNAYDAKAEALQYLNAALALHGEFTWGWGIDDAQEMHRHVLYVDTPYGQVSYHSGSNYGGPRYAGQWDGLRDMGHRRIIEFCDRVVLLPDEPSGDWLLMPFGKHVGKPIAGLDEAYFSWLAGWEGLASWLSVKRYIDGCRGENPQFAAPLPYREKVTWQQQGINDEFRKDESGVCPFETTEAQQPQPG